MALHFLDTSALLKLYVQEQGSLRMARLAAGADQGEIAISDIAEVELRSALRRREREGDLSAERVEDILAAFAMDLRSRFIRVLTQGRIINEALSLIDRRRLRAYDAMQLAACKASQIHFGAQPTFVCSDTNLLSAARAEELPTLNPLEDSE